MTRPILPNARTNAPAPPQRASGEGRLAVKKSVGRTRLDSLYQEGCAKIRLPNTHSNALEAALINTAGGLTGGDRLGWHVTAAPETRLTVTTQACERIYKSAGGPAAITTRIEIGDGAHVNWFPQETILFEHAILDRQLSVDMAPTASFLAVEAILLGRDAMGETAENAALTDNWRIRRDQTLVHAEATRLAPGPDARRAPALLNGQRALATVLFVGDGAETRLDRVRALLPADATIAASVTGPRLLVRALAPSGLALRRLIGPILQELSGGGLPRLWST